MTVMRVGVLGLARSGQAAARLAAATGSVVFASDAGGDDAVRAAAAAVRAAGGEAEIGGHTAVRLAECDLLVVSPGIPPGAPVLNDERLQGIPRVSELEFAFRHLQSPVIAVTGTNGKTTVTAWTAHLLTESGIDAVAAGNIGLPLSEVALREAPPRWVVVEASSYQLAGIERFRPRVGVVTNLAPDHLDRYPDLASYYADKARMFETASASSVWVLNGEDQAVLDLPGAAPGRRLQFHPTSKLPDGRDGAWVSGAGELVLRSGGAESALVRTNELRLLGRHNHANALAAALAAHQVLEDPAALAAGLRSFAPMPHRMEPIATVGGVMWVNDSKATNVASARVAIEGVGRPTVLLLGGRHKGESFGPLAAGIRARAKAVIAYGEAADRIVEDLAGSVPVERVAGPFAAVVARAAELASPGDAVLLAPACASFDMFRDFEDRGREFVRLVRALESGVGAEVGRG
jgi:UDP-N-acetylmuramoylalanine--D-glutamate ligase